jgi:TRAP-type mannitol/chloroaromatic compound transport system substrate-binding protein
MNLAGGTTLDKNAVAASEEQMLIGNWLVTGLSALALAAVSAALPAAAQDKTVKIRIQSVIPTSADEVTMLKDFAADVAGLTNNTVQMEVLPAGAVVAVNDTLDAVDKGLIEAGFAWTHYWSGKHPAATLFGSPAAGAGVGLDNLAWLSWFQFGGGKELYDELWKEMKVNIKGFILQPVGPEALGWFKAPIKSMADFRKLRFRMPPGIPGQIYKDVGVAAVAMGGGDILPALEKGLIDGAEWCCPKPDMVYGFQKVLKHYYLEGLHQNVVNADIYINGDVYKKLSPIQQKAIEVSANAALMKAHSYRIYENGKALKELVEKHGVQLHSTPDEYFKEYGAAALKTFEKHAADNAFFKKVWDSQRNFAALAIPFWAGAQKANAGITGAYAAELAKAKK